MNSKHIEEVGIFPNLFYETNMILTEKPDKDITEKRKLQTNNL